jgi:hypothetical protein
LITGVFPETSLVCGARFLDKSKPEFESNFRIEVWVKFIDEKIAPGVKISQYLEGQFA